MENTDYFLFFLHICSKLNALVSNRQVKFNVEIYLLYIFRSPLKFKRVIVLEEGSTSVLIFRRIWKTSEVEEA